MGNAIPRAVGARQCTRDKSWSTNPQTPPFALSSAKSHTQSERPVFVGQQHEQSVRRRIAFLFGLVGAVPGTMIFSFESATKFGPQMVYELNEKSTI
jgi:hypothetical protein